MSQNHPEAPPISNSRVKRLWKQKIARTEQELRIEKVEQMLDMMLVDKICKAGKNHKAVNAWFTPEGGKEIYLGPVTIVEEKLK